MIGVVIDVPGAGAQHAGVMQLVGGTNREVLGRLCHWAGPTDGGWLVVDIWASEEQCEAFLAEELFPAARRCGFWTLLIPLVAWGFAAAQNVLEGHGGIRAALNGPRRRRTGPQPPAAVDFQQAYRRRRA